jgi:hypothetical protein
MFPRLLKRPLIPVFVSIRAAATFINNNSLLQPFKSTVDKLYVCIYCCNCFLDLRQKPLTSVSGTEREIAR